MLFRKVVRSMMEHKSRYIGSILLLVLCSLMMVMMGGASQNLDIAYQALANGHVLSDAEFSMNADTDMTALAKGFDARIEQGGTADCEVKPGQTLRVFALMDVVNTPAVMEGRLPGPSEIMLDVLFADANGYTLGDTLSVAGKNFTVSGLCTLPNYIYVVESMEVMINDFTTFGVGVVGKADFAELPNSKTVYAVRFNQRENVQTQETALKNALRDEGLSILAWQSVGQKVNVSYIPMEVGTLKKAGTAVPAVMLILTCILLGMLMMRTLRSESVLLGTLFAQGYKKSELMRHYLMIPFMVTIVGSVIGSAAGLGLIDTMLDFMMSVFPMPRTTIVYNIPLVLVSVLVPMVMLCGLTWLIVQKSLKESPAALMRGDAANDKINILEKTLKLEKAPFKRKFKIREQVRSLPRSFFLLFGIAVASMLILYGLTLKSSIDYMLNKGIREAYNLNYEYVLTSVHQGEVPPGTEPFNAAYVTLADDDQAGFWVSGAMPDTQMLVLKDREGADIQINQNTITAALSELMGLKVGDTLTVVDTNNGKTHQIQIEQIADTYIGEFMYMPIAQFNAEFDMPEGSYLGVWSKEKLNFGEGEVAQIKSIDAIVAGFAELTNQMGAMIYSLFISAFIVGLIIIYIATGLVIEESKKTISLMKVFGYTRKEINQLILNSNTLIVILGYLLGIPALLGTVGALYRSLTQSMQMVLPVRLNALYMLIGFIVVILTYKVANWMSRKKVAKIPMSEALKAGTE